MYQRAAIALALSAAVAPTLHGQAFEGTARAGALADATTALIGAGSTIHNPAAAATQSHAEISLTGGESYGLASLRSAGLEIIVPARSVAGAIAVSTFGDDAFRVIGLRSGGAIAIGVGTSRRLYAGVAADYMRYAIRGYGSDAALGIACGVIAPISTELTIAFAASNFNSARVGADEAIEQTIAIGLGYTPENRVRLVGAIVKEIRHDPSARAGVELTLLTAFVARFGIGSNPTTASAGFGVRVGAIGADLAFQRHRFLGFSSAGSLTVVI